MYIEKTGHIRFFKTNTNCLKLIKIRDNFKCICCNNEIPKGSYCFKSNWMYKRLCLSCSDKYFEAMGNDINYFLKLIKSVVKDLKQNKEKYKLNNAVRGI